MDKDKDYEGSLWDNFTMNRREFIKKSSTAAIAAGVASRALTNAAAEEEAPESGGMKYRTLGRTGLKVSEISFGAIQIHNTGVAPLYRAFELGVNYIDTASGYGRGKGEQLLAEFLKEHRKEVYVATKWSGHFGYDTEKAPPVTNASKEGLIKTTEESLSKMGIETIDVIQMHAMSRPEQVEHPAALEAFEELKKAGKVRFLGLSTHSNEAIAINKAVEMGYFDVVLTAYSFAHGHDRQLRRAIEKAAEAGVGVVAMKSVMPVMPLREHSAHIGEIAMAALRWVLANENVANVIPTMRTVEEVDQDVSIVGKTISYRDMQMLEEYAQVLDGDFCRLCGVCSGACPQGVATDDIIRYAFYCKEYGDRDRAVELYRNLSPSQTVANCNRCGACNSACPYNLDVIGKLERAHEMLA